MRYELLRQAGATRALGLHETGENTSDAAVRAFICKAMPEEELRRQYADLLFELQRWERAKRGRMTITDRAFRHRVKRVVRRQALA